MSEDEETIEALKPYMSKKVLNRFRFLNHFDNTRLKEVFKDREYVFVMQMMMAGFIHFMELPAHVHHHMLQHVGEILEYMYQRNKNPKAFKEMDDFCESLKPGDILGNHPHAKKPPGDS